MAIRGIRRAMTIHPARVAATDLAAMRAKPSAK
jgi:hypothetical protein